MTPELAGLLDPHNIENIQDLNYIDFFTSDDIEGIKPVATRFSNQGQWISDTGTTDHMSGTHTKRISLTSVTVTIAGGRKLRLQE